jgi:flagellar L-ring protein precursor FlgH
MARSRPAAEASRSAASGPLAQAGPLAQTGPATQTDPVAPAPHDERPRVLLDRASWTYQPAPPLRVFQKNDVVTIRVDEITRVMAEGAAENRKRTLYEAILTDWVQLVDWRLKPDPQVDGDPAVTAESNSNYRAESSVESRESMTFNIAATVVDIRPNGNLVLEARKAIRVNDNLWETSLSGICRAKDIAPDNVVLSKDLIDLEIRKEDRGHLRDGYSRGWLQRFIDRFGFF